MDLTTFQTRSITGTDACISLIQSVDLARLSVSPAGPLAASGQRLVVKSNLGGALAVQCNGARQDCVDRSILTSHDWMPASLDCLTRIMVSCDGVAMECVEIREDSRKLWVHKFEPECKMVYTPKGLAPGCQWIPLLCKYKERSTINSCNTKTGEIQHLITVARSYPFVYSSCSGEVFAQQFPAWSTKMRTVGGRSGCGNDRL